MHFEIFSRLVVKLELWTLDSTPQDADVDLVRIDHVRVLKFVLEFHLKFRFERTQRRQSTRGENDRARVQRLDFPEANPRVETPEAKHSLCL